MELVAQLIEEVSILSSKHQRKKPRKVPRPHHITHPPVRAGTTHAVNVLKSSARR